jgi:hypothetical protein
VRAEGVAFIAVSGLSGRTWNQPQVVSQINLYLSIHSVVMILRVCALYPGSRTVLIFLGTMFCTQVAVQGFAVSQGIRKPVLCFSTYHVKASSQPYSRPCFTAVFLLGERVC